MEHATPIKQDKRLWFSVTAVAAVLGLTLAGHEPGVQVLEFTGTMVAFFCGQSQWGQTSRAKAAADAGSADAAK